MTDFTQPWYKSFKAQTFDPPPPNDIRFQGKRGLKTKKSIEGSFCRAKKGGVVWRPRLCLI